MTAIVREHLEVVMATVPTMSVWHIDNRAAAMAREPLMAAVATAKFIPKVATVGGHLKEAITRGHPSEATNSREYNPTVLLHMVVALMVVTINGILTLLRGKHMDIKPTDTEADSPATDR